jgi:hypothetical protein
MSPLIRVTFGGLIGLLAGISFGVTILPIVVERFLPGIPVEFYQLSATRFVPSALLWMPGGAMVGYLGGGRRGALVLGGWGVIVGLVYGVIVSPGGFYGPLLPVSALVGALYGAGAGLLVGAAFPPREELQAEAEGAGEDGQADDIG